MRKSLYRNSGLVRVVLCFAATLLMADVVQAQSNGVLREVYYNLTGSLSDMLNSPKYPNSPDQVYVEAVFEAPSNFADNYGQRMRALLVPPVTGSYTFWVASDDASILYLSTDETPAHKTQIASIDSWTPARAWSQYASQKSSAITLTKGQRYYIEAIHKEGTGGDNLAVTWQKPGDSVPKDNDPPIDGIYLKPYGLGPPVISSQPVSATVVEGGSATFSVQLSVGIGAVYQWQRDNVSIPGATNTSFTFFPAKLSDTGSHFSCYIYNAYGSTNSAVATLTVFPDTTRPTVSSIGNLGDPQSLTVIFSKALEQTSATNPSNYKIDNGITVTGASPGVDSRTVILTTTPMVTKTLYTLTVNNVQDLATTPNTILPDSQMTFVLSSTPLNSTLARPVSEGMGPSTRHGPVVISEIMYHPTNSPDGKNLQFIELFNSNPYFEDISGYTLTGDINYTFPSNTVLGGRGFLLVAASPADIQSAYGVANVIGGFTNLLSHSSGTLKLRSRQGGILFDVTYSADPPWPVAADGAGHSLVLARPSLGEANPAAWAASDVVGGSPGRAEAVGSSTYRSIVINEFLAHTDLPDVDYIELYNYSSVAVDISRCILTDSIATNKFIIPTNTVLQPQGFISFDETQLGFSLSAAGETIYLKEPNNLRVIDVVRFGAQENGVSMGRYPDGAPEFQRLQTKTPGTSNTRPRVSDVVINEIMYDPISGEDDDQYVELYNRTDSAVDVSKWSLEDGVSYTIPSGTAIPAKGYLVIARNAARLMTNYPNLNGANTLGNFSGKLAHGGERLALAMPDDITSTNEQGKVTTTHIHIAVDDVTWGTGGRWGQWAHGGGSSLELIDAHSDHHSAANWADSDESGKSAWQTVQVTGVLDYGNGTADSLQILMLGAGECLVDNVEVFLPGGQNLISNPDFETGLTGWVPQGNHENSTLEVGQGYNSSQCLHVRAPDHGDTGANRIRTTLKSTLASGNTATIRAKVRWIAGHPEILFRLHGNWLEATGNYLAARNFGTPGAPNTRAQANIGPSIAEVHHYPVVPNASQTVTVVARVSDPDGLAGLFLKYRIDPSTNLNIVPMQNNGAGLFSATIPGQAAGKLAAFHIQAVDNASPRGVSLFPSDAPTRECLVRWGDPQQSGYFGIYRVWMTQATLDRWSKREHLSNMPLDCTFVYGNSRIIYNIGGEYSGSPWHSPGYDTPLGNVCDYLLAFPEDDLLMGEDNATLQWPGNGGGDNTCQREQVAYWIANKMNLAYCYRRSINLFINGTRRGLFFEDVQQPDGNMVDEFYPDGKNGDLHKVQVWYEFDDAASAFVGNGASLQNLVAAGGGKQLAFYRWTFAKRAIKGSANNYTNLFALVDAVNRSGIGAAYRQGMESQMDVDNWLKTYAVEHIVGNNDSFAYGGGQNMYIYKPSGDLWKMMIWDIDFAFASLEPTSDPFAGIGRSNGIDLSEPAFARRYWQILKDMTEGPLVAATANPQIEARYNAMTGIIGVDNPAGIEDYIRQRRNYLLGLIATNVPLTSIQLDNAGGFSSSRNLVTISGVAPLDVRNITINGASYPITWISVTNWTAQVALTSNNNTIVVQGWTSQSNVVGSATVNVNYTGPAERAEDHVVINEIMYNPAYTNGAFVEIYNTSASCAFDLSGWTVSGVDFTFPPGSFIAPNSYLILAENRAAFIAAYGTLATVFGEFGGKLQKGGETLRLIKPGATPEQDIVVDEVRYDSVAPWPATANGDGASLQLIDPSQDHNRVGNWAAVATNPPAVGPQWCYVTATGTASSSALYIYLHAPGELYMDDFKLVAGSVPEVGVNLLGTGDFETSFPGAWSVPPNMSGSGLSTTIKHNGTASLHLVASSGGSTRGNVLLQDITPALNQGATYTLSFWYLQNPNGGTITARLSGSGIMTDSNVAPDPVSPALSRTTPGRANSVAASLPAFPTLWLNEINPNNVTGISDALGHRHPWLEVYNGGLTNVDLTGVFLSMDYSNLTQWTFPDGTQIKPGGFLLVWLDGNVLESSSNELHANFTVPVAAGSVALASVSNGKTNLLDYLNYAVPLADQSYGAYPDGTVSKRQLFFYTTPGGTNNPASRPLNVFINEWMADNKATLADPSDKTKSYDWFELYNPGDTVADLSGFYFGTSLTNRIKFLIPSGYTVPAHGYLLVWADEDTSKNTPDQPDLHVNFRLSKSGDAVGLFAPDGTTIDFVSFGVQATDISQGRYPDGSGVITNLAIATPRASNTAGNTPPVIAAIPDCVVFEGQLLVISVNATDQDLPVQKLAFTIDAGPTNAVINSETGLFSWRPSETQVAGNTSITLRATDDGKPVMSSTVTFNVSVVPRPKVASVGSNGHGGYAISFVTVPGKTYRVEYKDSLDDPQWHALAPDEAATSETLSADIDPSQTTQRFYRIVVP